MNIKLSILSPLYQSENIVEELVEQISANVSSITEDFEIILVEDESKDLTWEKIDKICKVNKKVKGIKLSRNFGQHYAITCALDHANGEWVVVMDCNLQNRPDQIIQLYTKAQEGFDVVLARREIRQDRFFKRFFSKVFYKSYR